MPEPLALNRLKQDLIFFHKMYDVARLVDPVRKTVLEYRGGKIEEICGSCYAYWKTGHVCDNCISIRAHHENKSYMKLEQRDGEIILVTAFPVETDGEAVILELLKNVTDSMIFDMDDDAGGRIMRKAVHEINDMVIRDHLTSLYNRRFIDGRLPADMVRAAVTRQPLTVLFIDVDDMKRINDTYGHAAGDLALKETAAAIRSGLRADTDWAARYGGDEFFVCLGGAGEEEAAGVVRRIRENIAAVEMPLQDGTVRIVASVGAQTLPEPPPTAGELIRMADKKMYEEKKARKKAQ